MKEGSDMSELQELIDRNIKCEVMMDSLEDFGEFELEDYDTADMVDYLQRIYKERELLISSLRASTDQREDTPCETFCGDIDRLETIVGNIGLSVNEYREVQAYLDSMYSHIQVMIDLE